MMTIILTHDGVEDDENKILLSKPQLCYARFEEEKQTIFNKDKKRTTITILHAPTPIVRFKIFSASRIRCCMVGSRTTGWGGRAPMSACLRLSLSGQQIPEISFDTLAPKSRKNKIE